MNEHYVPQSYLRQFTFDGKFLFVFDKVTKRPFLHPTNIKNLACERYFYDLPGDDSHLVEIILGKLIDGNYPTWIDSLLATVNKGLDIDQRQKENIALCMANQLLRTKKYRYFNQEIVEETFSAMLQITLAAKVKWGGLKLDTPLDAYRVEYNQEWAPLDQARSMFGPSMFRITNILCNHIWVVGKNNTKKPLYTSDNPVVWDTQKEFPPCRGVGLVSEGIEVAFPLTPRYILVLYERKFFTKYEKLDGKCIELNSENVKYYNSFQVYDSYRQIYCPSSDFNLAEDICNKNPGLF